MTFDLTSTANASFGAARVIPHRHDATRGAVFVEYTIILVLVAVVAIPVIIFLGVALSAYYTAQQTVITLPFP